MSLLNEYMQLKQAIGIEADRLGFDDRNLDEMAYITCRQSYRKLHRGQLKALLIELRGMDEAGESLHPDSPLAKWQTKQISFLSGPERA